MLHGEINFDASKYQQQLPSPPTTYTMNDFYKKSLTSDAWTLNSVSTRPWDAARCPCRLVSSGALVLDVNS